MQDTARLRQNLTWLILLAESTHVLCCVLPTLITVLALLVSFGAVAPLPVFWLDIHEFLHAYEIPVLMTSGAILGLGWVGYAVARRIECARPRCGDHETGCAPAKDRTRWVLVAATLLFAVNVTVYFTLHRGSADLLHEQAAAAHAAQDHD